MSTDSPVRETVRAYSDARFRGDIATAAALTGDGFLFRSPFITSDSPNGHLDGLEGLLSIVSKVEMISELYGESQATLIYDLHTVPAVGITQRTAEHFRLRDGRITAITLIFDSAPWQAIMAAAGPTVPSHSIESSFQRTESFGLLSRRTSRSTPTTAAEPEYSRVMRWPRWAVTQ